MRTSVWSQTPSDVFVVLVDVLTVRTRVRVEAKIIGP